MNLRPATQTDLPGIRDVADRSLAASYDDVIDQDTRQQAVEVWYSTESSKPGALVDELEDDRTVVIVADDEGEIAGFVQAFLVGDDPRIGQIEWLHVRPARRGEGIADRLLDEVESTLAERGADRIESRVIEENTAGRGFYEYHDYEPEQTRQITIAGDQMIERTLVADVETTTDAGAEFAKRRETEDGKTVVIAYDESERGTKGPFHATYLDDERQELYGWHCGVCDSLDVNMSSMGEIVCDDCGNDRLPRRWDAAYGG